VSIAKHLVPRPVADRYLDIKRRLDRLELSVRNLETTLDAFLVYPRYVAGDDIGFNGQLRRKELFKELVTILHPEAIIETGTWIGNTTGYMAQNTGLPIRTCEVNPRFHAIAKMRVEGISGLHLELSDSRQFLEKLSETDLTKKRVFFYLDAHWYDELPLSEEIDVIARHWGKFAIMIDDFKVPDDTGYGYDDYGPGKALCIELIEPMVRQRDLAVYFPSVRSDEDTGA